MKVLVINAGSSSCKYQLLEMDTETVLASGLAERIGQGMGKLTHKIAPDSDHEEKIVRESAFPTHVEAMELVISLLTDPEKGVIKDKMDGENMRDSIFHMINDYIENTVDAEVSVDQDYEDWDLIELNRVIGAVIPMAPVTPDDVKGMGQKELKHLLKERAAKAYEAKEAEFPEPEHIRELERVVLLKVIDAKWMDHIDDMDQLRQGIGLQAYGNRDPKIEYKMLGYDMFGEMTQAITETTVRTLMHVRIEQKAEREQVAKVTGTNKDDTALREPKKRENKKVYPNDPCPCGSGKKYKQCCGRNK